VNARHPRDHRQRAGPEESPELLVAQLPGDMLAEAAGAVGAEEGGRPVGTRDTVPIGEAGASRASLVSAGSARLACHARSITPVAGSGRW
jgi:hypothetical protein